MKKRKILLIIVGIAILLILAFAGFVAYNGYAYYGFYDDAENIGSVVFGSELFNEKLRGCQLSYADTWEIRGLKNNNCVVSFKWSSDINYNKGLVDSDWIVCELPYGIYGDYNSLDWDEVLEGEFCFLK